MNMVRDRVLTTHTYNEATARQISRAALQSYFPELLKLHVLLQSRKDKDLVTWA